MKRVGAGTEAGEEDQSGMPAPWISFSAACLLRLQVPTRAFADRSASTKICYP
jgi:hypothetical protein